MSANVKVIAGDRSANGGALAASLVVSAVPGRLYSLTVFNTGGDQYIQVHDAAALPAEGAVPKLCMKVLADSQGSIDFGGGRIFGTGIVVCNSSTAGTKTIGGADCLMDVVWRKTDA